MAVAMVASGRSAEHRNGEGLQRNHGHVEVLPATSDWVPDNEVAPFHLVKGKENTPMATVEGGPRDAVEHRLGEWECWCGGNEARNAFEEVNEEVPKQRRGWVEAAVPAEESGVGEEAPPGFADEGGAE